MLLAILLAIVFSLPNLSVAKPPVNDIEETYHVIVTSGTIVNKTNNQPLQRGMKISAKDQVVFKSSKAKAIVIGTKRGRFVLSARSSATSSELVAFVTEVLSPLKSNSKLSSRDGDSDVVYNFEDFFYGIETPELRADIEQNNIIRNFVVLGDALKFRLLQKTHPLDKHNFLVIRYIYQGKAISKIFPHKGDEVTLSKQELFTHKGTEIPVDAVNSVELYFLRDYDPSQGKKGKRSFLVKFKPIFLDEAEMTSTFEALSKVYKKRNLSEKEQLTSYFQFILDVYGDYSGYTKTYALESFLKEKELL